MDVLDIQNAHETFSMLTKTLVAKKLKYFAETENYAVLLKFEGADLDFDIKINVGLDPCVISVTSELPFKVFDAKINDFAIAICKANCNLAFGYFDFERKSGIVSYKCSMPYKNSILGQEAFGHLIDNACFVIEKYNDRFFSLNIGKISIKNF